MEIAVSVEIVVEPQIDIMVSDTVFKPLTEARMVIPEHAPAGGKNRQKSRNSVKNSPKLPASMSRSIGVGI